MNLDFTNINSIFTYFQEDGLVLVFKVLTLLLLFVFIIYNFIVVNRVKSLNKTLYLKASNASAMIQVVAIILLFAAISLFVITLVIV